MNLDFNHDGKQKVNRFGKLGMWYALALSLIVSIAIAGQWLIQRHLRAQRSDSHVINVAGRQRMLSERIAKFSLMLRPVQEDDERDSIARSLRETLHLWTICHVGLQRGDDSLQLPGGNSKPVRAMFLDLNIHFDALHRDASFLAHALRSDPQASYDSLSPAIEGVLIHQQAFLDGMNNIVFQYDTEANNKVATLSRLEYILLAVSILVILLEILFVFRPTTIQVNRTVNQLIASETNAKKLSKEIGALYTSLERSYEALAVVNVPVETPKLYGKTDRGGNVIFVSDLCERITGKTATPGMKLTDLFPGARQPDAWMDEIIDALAEGKTWQGTVQYHDRFQQPRWADLMIVPALNETNEVEEWLVLGADMTPQKRAEVNMRDKNRAEIDKKINQQKFRSVLILEGQEEERKRLAMDIHDGIGQMLTSLKFRIESIDINADRDMLRRKLPGIQQLLKEVMQEVRRVTFNLKPTVLGDYGLQAALNVFIKEIGKLSNTELVYMMEGDPALRLPQKVENNIFRIIQEAINNAIKYAEATRIEVQLQQTESEVIIVVADNGRGFDEKMVEAQSANIESGRGFFNMHERTEYINGRLAITSVQGQGTRVVLTVPIRTTANA